MHGEDYDSGEALLAPTGSPKLPSTNSQCTVDPTHLFLGILHPQDLSCRDKLLALKEDEVALNQSL